MACCKIYLTLSALITCHVSANYEYERSKSLSSDSTSHPWYKQYEVYENAPSEIQPHYNFHGLTKDRPAVRPGGPSEPSSITAKKEPTEEKNLKKIPFYAFANKDSTRYKELTPDLGIAHCQEIKVTSAGEKDDKRKGVTTCYNCKDPKTKSTYERCLYSSHPEESTSANTRIWCNFIFEPLNMKGQFVSTIINITITCRRRSSFERSKDDYGRLRSPYRFTDEYFTDATRDVPAAYENKGEKCDKVVKDSMVCMVCKDAKTNGKYEQCSYVKKPHEKAYSYLKSSSFGKPQRDDESDESSETPHSEVSDDEGSDEQKDRSPSTVQSREYFYPSTDYPEKASTVNKRDEVRDEVQDAPSADCKQVQKDSKTCTVCKDSKTGGTYEKCTYNYQPSDKLYKYSKSKTFGYPGETADSTSNLNKTQKLEKPTNFDYPQSSDSAHDYLDKLEPSTYPGKSDKEEAQQTPDDSDGIPHGSPDYSSDYSNPEESSDYRFPSRNNDHESYESQKTPSSKPVSEHYSENISADNCKTVQKDSMTCKVCKDPETGNDFEQCSYTYQPSDKLYSYSKSSSFGNPENADKPEQTSREDEHSSDSSESPKKSYGEYVSGPTYEASTTDEAKSEDNAEEKKGVDAGYLDTAKKKAEIEEFMQNFRKEDRSKCKKIMRDRMTCYQCVDDEGFQKEECAFVTGHEPDKDQLAFHETKEFQVEAAPRGARDSNKPTGSRKTKAAESLEPSASASRNTYVRLEKPDNEYPDEASQTAEETKGAEPYDYTSETRAKYDKVLRLTLPAYMFSTSEHEAAFDEIVASSHNRR
ncbi:PREDICTED: eukaryotic translation initiation factor 5B-like [Vollenhovia emeryi]|uniref:eukaryotic translation initiation factor 5B-like n=1 Tax=Vollenhovia emeryi TaxID=411798 RepID=UPI0005F44DB1|nr:PREDICTED: eukaryotic translation initiation factor 5B-like [Vollenhovia emeryi]